MIKQWLLGVFILLYAATFAQEKPLDSVVAVKDTVHYIKTTDYALNRVFKDAVETRYTDDDFTYTEEKEKSKTDLNLNFVQGLVTFLKLIFPFLIGAFIVFLIIKLALGSEKGFWNFKKQPKKVAEKLVYADEDIHEVDLDALLKKAISESNYRLAIRYNYLAVLKILSSKK